MAENKIRVALVGAGYIAKWHADALKRTRGVELTAVCDISAAAAEGIASAYGSAKVFTSIDEMLAAKVCDAAHILTPPHTHFEAASKVLGAGVAVFVEKPCAITAGDCETLAGIAAARGARIGVNHNFLMLPSYDRLKADLASGVIGQIDTIEANWQFPLGSLRAGPFNLWMLREPQNLLHELGPHLFAFIADICGGLENIDVRMRHPIAIPGGVTHFQSWQITGVARGAAATLNLSLIEGHDNRSLRLRGLGGQATYDFAQDVYRIETPHMADIVIGPLASQLSLAGQSLKTGIRNAARQMTSLNELAPYGLSIVKAVHSFYTDWAADAPVDSRLSIDLATGAARMIEASINKAALSFAVAKNPAPPQDAKPFNGQTVLVIGGSGFIGRALTTALADEGYAVRVFSRGAGSGLERPDGRVSVFTGSLKSRDDLLEAMQGVVGVYHLAKATETSWQGYLENDVNVTRLIGECCVEADVARLVYTGTIDSYDASQPDRPITELTPFDEDLERRNLYGRSKAACEDALLVLARDRGLRLVIARPGIVIGKGGPLAHWGIAMWRGATACKLWGDGQNIMPFVLVDDVAQGLVKCLTTRDIIGKSFNLIGEPMLSSRDYFKAIETANSVAIRAKPTPIWTYYTIDVVKYWAKRLLAQRTGMTKPSFRDWKSRAKLSPHENGKAKAILGWAPETDRGRFVQRGIVDANLFGVGGDDNALPRAAGNVDPAAQAPETNEASVMSA